MEARQVQVPLSHLKLEFQRILFDSKNELAVRLFEKINSSFTSTSMTDSASVSLYYEDYRALQEYMTTQDMEALRGIAKLLYATDYDHFHDCLQGYIDRRKELVNTILDQLHKKMNLVGRVRVQVFENWDELSERIQGWTQVAKICIVHIFVKEKFLYKEIFGGLGTAQDADGFVHIIADAAVKIFEFPDSLMGNRQLTHKLEVLLPLYKDMLNLMPAVNELFQKDLCLPRSIHSSATGIMSRFAEHMTRMISASERHVLRELSTNPTPAGAIHPLTQYVIRYVNLIFNHREALKDLIVTPPALNDLATQELDTVEIDQESAPLRHHLTRIIEYLLYNLSYKSKFHDQESLSHMFMMNNVHFVALKMESDQGLHDFFGKRFQMKLNKKVRKAMTDYLTSTWDGVCYCLINEGSKSLAKCIFFPGKSGKALKEKIKNFNRMFEYVHRTQKDWEVPDKHLRQQLHNSILKKLNPAYSHFLQHFNSHIEKFQHPERYVIYSVKDMESKVSNMFRIQDQ